MKKILLQLFLPLGIVCTLFSCQRNQNTPADYILKGVVRTMEDAHHEADKTFECVAVAGDEILFVGKFEEAKKKHYEEGKTKIIDCGNQLILPGFIDAHAHVGLAAMTSMMADLSGPPYGKDTTMALIIRDMKDYIKAHFADNPTAMAIGNNYDDAQLIDHKQPTKEQLDLIDPVRPIYLLHVSGHMGVANSAFLRMLNISDKTPTDSIAGGTIVKENGKTTGLLLENANILAINAAVGLSVPKGLDSATKYKMALARLKDAENEWFRYGVTTICEGRADAATVGLIMKAASDHMLTGDFIVMPDYDENAPKLKSYVDYYNKYTNHFKIGGVKFTFDGSPQGKDAFLSQPYHTPMIGQNPDYHGHPIYPYDSALKYVEIVENLGMPVHIHLNGDSAIDMALKIFQTLKSKNKLHQPTPNVMIHCQTARKDQLVAMKALMPDVMQSFFPTHVYVWGDWYRTNVLDTTRAKYISPLFDADSLSLNFTIHTDAPITPPDLLAGVYAAVNRRTQSGYLLGGDQRIHVYRALRAITKDGAKQWGEEATKGILAKGLKADIVVLDKDLITMDPMGIKDVKVVYTFKDGKQVYPIPDKVAVNK